MASTPWGWGCTSGLSRFPGLGNLRLCSGGWSWISSLECSEVSSSEFWGVYGFGMALGSLSLNAQYCVPDLLKNQWVCLALELVGSWVELGFSVGMKTFGCALVY